MRKCFLALLFFWSYSVAAQVTDPKLTVYYVDVGMGDAIFLDIPPKDCMLIDGGSWDRYGIDNLLEFLDKFMSDPDHAAYEKTIDVVVASHQHKDHILGLIDVLKKYKVKEYFDNGLGWARAKSGATKEVKGITALIAEKHIDRIAITNELVKTKGNKGLYTSDKIDPFTDVDVFALAGSSTPVDKNPNNNSVILRVECGDVSFLFTGDAMKKEEEALIGELQAQTNIAALDVDVLKIGHHGSKTSSIREFLDATSPKVCVVSVGVASESPKTKGYRLPNESVIDRLFQSTSNTLDEHWEVDVFPDKRPKNIKTEKPKRLGSNKEIYFTSEDGTIVIKTDGVHMEVGFLEEEND